jgi:hypothetical protein
MGSAAATAAAPAPLAKVRRPSLADIPFLPSGASEGRHASALAFSLEGHGKAGKPTGAIEMPTAKCLMRPSKGEHTVEKRKLGKVGLEASALG